jgi:hypothetical protein
VVYISLLPVATGITVSALLLPYIYMCGCKCGYFNGSRNQLGFETAAVLLPNILALVRVKVMIEVKKCCEHVAIA